MNKNTYTYARTHKRAAAERGVADAGRPAGHTRPYGFVIVTTVRVTTATTPADRDVFVLKTRRRRAPGTLRSAVVRSVRGSSARDNLFLVIQYYTAAAAGGGAIITAAATPYTTTPTATTRGFPVYRPARPADRIILLYSPAILICTIRV